MPSAEPSLDSIQEGHRAGAIRRWRFRHASADALEECALRDVVRD